VDAVDQTSARPDLVCLGYALMSVGSGAGQFPGPDAEARQSLTERVKAGLAPTFLVHAADDRTVPVANSLNMFQALKAADVPCEMHIYQEGGHGFGFSLPGDRPASHWPDAFEAWARRSGFFAAGLMHSKRRVQKVQSRKSGLRCSLLFIDFKRE
jgi:acetyl esterase/lipase